MTILWAGLSTGAVYALVALTFTVVLTSADVFNFAQPQFMMLGAFLGYWGLSQHHVPFLLVVLGTAAIGGLIGLVEERVAIRPLASRGGYAVLVTTVGFSVVLNGIALVIWGSNPESVPVPYNNNNVRLFGGSMSLVQLALIVIAVAAGLVLHLAASRTRWGMAGRATAADPTAAIARGVNTLRLKKSGFVLAGIITAVVGILIGADLGASTDLGNNLVIVGFVAMSLGGNGSYVGALVGGLLAGLIQTYTDRYIGTQYDLVILFGVLIAVLLIRPSGLFGRRQVRAV